MTHDHFDTKDEKGEPKQKGTDSISPRALRDAEEVGTERIVLIDTSEES